MVDYKKITNFLINQDNSQDTFSLQTSSSSIPLLAWTISAPSSGSLEGQFRTPMGVAVDS
jgi:hypothetical protein